MEVCEAELLPIAKAPSGAGRGVALDDAGSQEIEERLRIREGDTGMVVSPAQRQL